MYKIYYFNDFNELDDENWKLKLDITNLYSKLESKDININTFVEKFNNFLISKREKINKISTDCLNEINTIIEKCDIKTNEDFYKYIDSIYDWADSNNINIKCNDEKNNETFSKL